MSGIEALAQAGSPGGAAPTGLEVFALLLMVVGVILLGMLFTLSIRGKLSQRQEETPSPRERIEQIRGGGMMREDVAAEEARLLSLAQRLSSQLDAKAQRLEQLLEEASRRVEELDALDRGSQVPHQRAASLGRQAARIPGSEGSGFGVKGEMQRSGGAKTREKDAVDVNRASPKEVAVAARDPLTAEIYRLADSGREPVEIARELEEQIGKIELILALRGSEFGD